MPEPIFGAIKRLMVIHPFVEFLWGDHIFLPKILRLIQKLNDKTDLLKVSPLIFVESVSPKNRPESIT